MVGVEGEDEMKSMVGGAVIGRVDVEGGPVRVREGVEDEEEVVSVILVDEVGERWRIGVEDDAVMVGFEKR